MDRLISQFEVIRAIEKYTNNIFTKNMGDLINDIKAIPSAELRYYPPCEDCHKKMNEIRKAYDKIPSAESKTGHWIMPVQDDGMSDPIYYQVRCSECGFDLDPQTWHQELHQYNADKFCPKCGCLMKIRSDKG